MNGIWPYPGPPLVQTEGDLLLTTSEMLESARHVSSWMTNGVEDELVPVGRPSDENDVSGRHHPGRAPDNVGFERRPGDPGAPGATDW
jgi:hypothetical protein